jgi:hypothetical protein
VNLNPRRGLAYCALLATGCLCSAFAASPAAATTGAPQWTVTAVSAPTNFTPGDESGDDVYQILVTNTGSGESDGTITITDELPQGLTLDHAGTEGHETTPQGAQIALSCAALTCTFSGHVIPQQALIVTIPVDVELKEPAMVTNVVRVSGGGATDATMSTPTTISSTPAGFGIAAGSTTTALSNTQAGAHADLTTTIGFNTLNAEGKVAGDPKEVVDELPPGFGGDLVDTPVCSVAVFDQNECPIETQVGVQTTTLAHKKNEYGTYISPVYNLAPGPGDVAKLGFLDVGVHIQAGVTVSPGEYRLQTRFENIIEISSLGELDSTSLTIWGIPTASIHDPWRANPKAGVGKEFGVSSANPLVPYLSNPTSCTSESIDATISASSWQEPGKASATQMPFGPLEACDRLTLPASFVAQPTTQEAYAPTGLNTELTVQQTYNNAEGLSSAQLNKAIVKLPEGITINPSAGAGLGACTEEEYEQEALETPVGKGCPNDSKLGTVKIQAPAIKEEALGSVYIATPYENQFKEPGHPTGSLLALYIVVRIPNRGVIVKSAGKVELNQSTGQLTTVFEDLPQLPFTTLTISLHQGQTSPLVSPPACGSFTATAELTGWSNLGETLTDDSLPFEILHGFGGGTCPIGGIPPFNPDVSAGTLSNDAGSYSPLELRVTRNDGEQEITGFASQLPPGLTANLTGVPFCPEADITLARTKTGAQEETEPSCPAASEIGQTLVGAGVGSVLAATHGKIYMAGPFEGAPFSVAAITSAKVGPFDLGTVVVHLPLEINPVTAAVSIPAGAADQIPHIIDGIVIHVRDIRVDIDRPNFTLNPTNCEPLRFTATVIGSGTSFTDPADNDPVTVNDPYRVTACQALTFKPTFQVFTSGKTSKANGASLTAKLTYPRAPQGTQANIAKVKVELPKRLPSRLTTLQKACTETVFDTNPARCPTGSIVGTATAVTPIIPTPLTGPAYFVSHGGAKFPELVIILQGYGITLDLHGETFISKQGITTSTFATVPDAPVGSFELKLLQGPHSALAANGNLCNTKLTIPTTFTAQNGITTHQTTKITVTNCPKNKNKTKNKTKHKTKHTKKRPNKHT